MFWRLFWKRLFAKKLIFTNLWRHEGVNFADFTHLTQIYEKLIQSILLQIFWRLFWKKKLRKKNDFHQFMTSWRCEFCWFYQKMRFFALFYPFNPNIWKIYPTYLVANFLNIILKFYFAKKLIFTNLWRHEGVKFADFIKKLVFCSFWPI